MRKEMLTNNNKGATGIKVEAEITCRHPVLILVRYQRCHQVTVLILPGREEIRGVKNKIKRRKKKKSKKIRQNLMIKRVVMKSMKSKKYKNLMIRKVRLV